MPRKCDPRCGTEPEFPSWPRKRQPVYTHFACSRRCELRLEESGRCSNSRRFRYRGEFHCRTHPFKPTPSDTTLPPASLFLPTEFICGGENGRFDVPQPLGNTPESPRKAFSPPGRYFPRNLSRGTTPEPVKALRPGGNDGIGPARSRSRHATLYTEGSDSFVASAAASIATRWSEPVPGRESHPLKSSAFSRRTFAPVNATKQNSGNLSLH